MNCFIYRLGKGLFRCWRQSKYGSTHLMKYIVAFFPRSETQPPGGVKKGETFQALYRIHTLRRCKSMHVKMASGWRPGNQWHADLFGCLEYGCCHPSLVHSFCCCHWILLAQIANRMNLNCLGQWVKANTPRRSLARDTFTNVFLIFASYITMTSVVITILANQEQQDDFQRFYLIAMLMIASIAVWCWLLLLYIRTRTSIRESYGIPSTVVQDCLVVVCCRPCALSQMARQTADYDRQGARWFTETGVSDDFDEEFGLNVPISVMDSDFDII